MKIATCTAGELRAKTPARYEREMAAYRSVVEAREQGFRSVNTVGQVQKVDQKSYVKHGITHAIRYHY